MSQLSVNVFMEKNNENKGQVIINSLLCDYIAYGKFNNFDLSSGELSKKDRDAKSDFLFQKTQKFIQKGYLIEEDIRRSIENIVNPAMILLDLLKYCLMEKNIRLDYSIKYDSLIIEGVKLIKFKETEKSKAFSEPDLKIIFTLQNDKMIVSHVINGEKTEFKKICIRDKDWKEQSVHSINETLNEIALKSEGLLQEYFEETAQEVIKSIKKLTKKDSGITYKITSDFNYDSLVNNKFPILLILNDDAFDISDIKEPVKVSSYYTPLKSFIEKQKIKQSLSKNLQEISDKSVKKRI